MNIRHTLCLILIATVFSACSRESQTSDVGRIVELDAYWAEVSRCVNEGDFQGYKATCHKDGVLVAGTSDKAYPLSDALKRWEKDFTQTQSGDIQASVAFRFSKRLGDGKTAHETGMFLYSQKGADGVTTKAYIHFEALLIKRGTWKTMMEYQKSKATEEEWNELK